jgi:hypothetical protein
MLAALQSDLTVTADSSLFDPATGKLAIARAYRKIGGMFKWPDTMDSKKTSTIATHEYYDYPTNWRTNSVWKLMVDGVDYGDPLAFKDYNSEKENNFPSGLTLLWANYGRQYFVTNNALPPQTNGDNNIFIWGQKVVDPLVNDSDTTIFSFHLPEVNEAIILEASAILKQKGEIMQVLRRLYISGSELLSYQSTSIVNSAWQKISQEMAKQEKTIPMFQVPDFFPSSKNRNQIKWSIGNFNNNN